MGKSQELDSVRTRAAQQGFHVADPDRPPAGITVVKGEWPGVQMARGRDAAAAGPTGVPWVDSNGWLVRLEARPPSGDLGLGGCPSRPGCPHYGGFLPDRHGGQRGAGRPVDSLARRATGGGLCATGVRRPWPPGRTVTAAAGFFAAHKAGRMYVPAAVAGVVSDFGGENEFFSRELLNLLDRAGQHYRDPAQGPGRRFLVRLPPRRDLYRRGPAARRICGNRSLAFVQAGGMLITGPKWGEAPGTPAKGEEHPRFSWRTARKGKSRAGARGRRRSLPVGRRFGGAGEPPLRPGAFLERRRHGILLQVSRRTESRR